MALSISRKSVVVGLALILTLFLGVVDYVTGRDFALSAFYLIPICWAGWKAGQPAAIFLSAVSAIAWFVADLASGFVYEHPLTPYWNAWMLFILYLVVVFLLSAFQTAHYHLEETVQRRTAALQKEIFERKRLETAKIQADRLAAVGTMASQVAHEIRNPLGSMALNLDLVQKEINKLAVKAGGSSAEAQCLLKDLRAEMQRIQRVIEDYLKFARLPKLERRPIDLNAFLGQKLAFLSSELKNARVKLHTGFDPSPGTIDVDGEQLWQALLNLIRNSLEAMPNGGEITVGTWKESGEVRLRVTDNGNGMTPEQLRQVFAPFFTTKTQGTGLGLTLVQQIVIEHGGHVECDSAAGKGTTFTIFLPLQGKRPA